MAHDRRHYRRGFAVAVALLLSLPAAVASQDDQSAVEWRTDGFDSANLADTGWIARSPAGRGLATVENSTLQLRASGDLAADSWRRHDSLQVTRPAPDADVVLQTTMGTVPILAYEAQGLAFINNEFDFLRIDVIGDRSEDGEPGLSEGRRLYAASSTAGTPTVHASIPVDVSVPYDLRVRRDNDLWTVFLIDAGGDARLITSFVHPMIVRSFGPFATARGFQGTASFVGVDVLEGGGAPSLQRVTDDLPPLMQGLVADNIDDGVAVAWTTDERTTGEVTLTPDDGTEPLVRTGEADHDHRYIFLDAEQNVAYDIAVVSTDDTGNQSTGEISLHTYAPPALPIIEIYGGDDRRFGQQGDAQPTLTLTGLVTSPSGAFTLEWRLGDEPFVNYPLDARSARILDIGEFAIELERAELIAEAGPDRITRMEIRATEIPQEEDEATDAPTVADEDPAAEEFEGPAVNTVFVDIETLESIDAGPNDVIEWDDADIDTIGQIANGGWQLDGDGIRPSEPGPVRAFLIGDQSWSEYEVELSMVAGEIAPAAEAGGAQPWAGVYLGWRGFDPTPNALGALLRTSGGAGFGQGDGGVTVVGVRDEEEFIANSPPAQIEVGQRYHLRAHAQSVAGGTNVRMKMWIDGEDEPELWTVEAENPGGLGGGSLALIAHRWDVVFETVTVTPLS